MPFVKINGKCICMKGSNVEEELCSSKNAIRILNGMLSRERSFILPNTDMERAIIEIKKVKNISNVYPRKAGIPNKKPL